jgi:hypothetical protein
MLKRLALSIFSLAVFSLTATAQTNTFPLNGNVGIGTTTPARNLQVEQDWNNAVALSLVNSTAGTDAYERYSIGMTPSTGTNYADFTFFNTGFIGNGVYAPNEFVIENSDIGGVVIASYNQSGNVSINTGASATPRIVATPTGNVGIGTASPQYALDVAGIIRSSSGGVMFPDGSTQTTAFIPANCGADFAESVGVGSDRTKYEPGDLMVIDPDKPGSFLKSNQPYSTLVAGVYSTKPGFVGRKHPASDPASADEVPMAMVGRVPTKVSTENGPIKVGDLLVASSTPGYAMKGTDHDRMLGAVIGKALGPLDSGTGVIEVLVTLQ